METHHKIISTILLNDKFDTFFVIDSFENNFLYRADEYLITLYDDDVDIEQERILHNKIDEILDNNKIFITMKEFNFIFLKDDSISEGYKKHYFSICKQSKLDQFESLEDINILDDLENHAFLIAEIVNKINHVGMIGIYFYTTTRLIYLTRYTIRNIIFLPFSKNLLSNQTSVRPQHASPKYISFNNNVSNSMLLHVARYSFIKAILVMVKDEIIHTCNNNFDVKIATHFIKIWKIFNIKAFADTSFVDVVKDILTEKQIESINELLAKENNIFIKFGLTENQI